MCPIKVIQIAKFFFWQLTSRSEEKYDHPSSRRHLLSRHECLRRWFYRSRCIWVGTGGGGGLWPAKEPPTPNITIIFFFSFSFFGLSRFLLSLAPTPLATFFRHHCISWPFKYVCWLVWYYDKWLTDINISHLITNKCALSHYDYSQTSRNKYLTSPI